MWLLRALRAQGSRLGWSRASAALTCPEEESAFEGDTVTLRCTYEGALRTRPKYWCREVGVFISRCANKIFSGEDGQEVRQGRASILDRPGELALVVTLRGLTLQDSGKYWCGAQKLGPDDACLVALAVLPGSSRPAVLPDSSTAGDPGPVSSSHSSVPSVSIPTARLLAPILVILSLLLAAGLIALGAHVLQGRRPALWAEDTQRGKKLYFPAAPLEASWVPKDTVVSLARHPNPLTSSSLGSTMEICYLNQARGEEEALSQAPEAAETPVQCRMSEEPDLAEFIAV
ncbi:CMRF35-like molecule 9 [Fukomys damarensis]|uniref:CMRF35-like molecule 9 n=1 Tax=Fukomys damarensis TaxID=885580 RepID=A0A091DR56_FUKDA|nr:CMRF35-like molecule 9 [Fukomys damarensis]